MSALAAGVVVALTAALTQHTANGAFTATTTTTANGATSATLAPVTSLTATSSCVPGPAPTVVGHDTAGKSGSAYSLKVPSSVESGDVLIAHVFNTNESTEPSGFTLVHRVGREQITNGAVYRRTATATDRGKTYAWSAANGAAALIAVRGGQLSHDAGGASLTAPSLPDGKAGDLLLTLYGTANEVRFSEPPGMTKLYDFPRASSASLTAAHRSITGTGATGDRTSTATGSTGYAASHSLLIRPRSVPEVKLTWPASASNFATGYQVRRGGAVVATVTGRNTTTWTDTSGITGPRTYRVYAQAGPTGGWLSASSPERPSTPSAC